MDTAWKRFSLTAQAGGADSLFASLRHPSRQCRQIKNHIYCAVQSACTVLTCRHGLLCCMNKCYVNRSWCQVPGWVFDLCSKHSRYVFQEDHCGNWAVKFLCVSMVLDSLEVLHSTSSTVRNDIITIYSIRLWIMVYMVYSSKRPSSHRKFAVEIIANFLWPQPLVAYYRWLIYCLHTPEWCCVCCYIHAWWPTVPITYSWHVLAIPSWMFSYTYVPLFPYGRKIWRGI